MCDVIRLFCLRYYALLRNLRLDKGKRWRSVSYIAQLTRWPDQRAYTVVGSGSWLARANGAAAQTAAIQLHALTYNWTRSMQLANTPPLQSTAPGLHLVSIHQTSPLVRGSKHPITAYYSTYRPRKDERLSRPAWLVTYRNKVPPPGVEPVHITHPSTNRARRRVTSLIRPTLLPLSHAATR